MNNYKDLAQKKQFRKTLLELVQALLTAGALTLLIYFFGGFYKKTYQMYVCRAEKVVEYEKKKQFLHEGSYFAGGAMQSTDFAHSYKYSVKLTKAHPDGFNFEIPSAEGDEDIWISVWRYNPEGTPKKGKLICKSGNYYKDTEVSKETQKSGWQKLMLRAYLPLTCRNEKIEVYCVQVGDDPVYFDDLEIEVKRIDK